MPTGYLKPVNQRFKIMLTDTCVNQPFHDPQPFLVPFSAFTCTSLSGIGKAKQANEPMAQVWFIRVNKWAINGP